jgi:hypothetical protein
MFEYACQPSCIGRATDYGAYFELGGIGRKYALSVTRVYYRLAQIKYSFEALVLFSCIHGLILDDIGQDCIRGNVEWLLEALHLNFAIDRFSTRQHW